MAEIPKTLLAWAGAVPSPAAWSRAVLLLIDCQLEYVTGRLPLAGVDAALAEVASLLARARELEVPVIHVVHHGASGGFFDPAAPFTALAPQVARTDIEPVVAKRLPNAFAGTSLKDALEILGRKELIVAGFMTHMCVSSTVRAGLELGFRSTVVASACATRDLPGYAGGVVSAAEVQRATLAALATTVAKRSASAADVPEESGR
jgi:nicotinamidase-related amidase